MYLKNYLVGREFPNDEYRDVIGSAALLTNYCFDAAFFTQGVSSADATLFRNGTFRYGAFVREFVPFVIFEVGSHFTFEMTLNLVGLPPKTSATWLNDAAANAVNMFLIDQPSYLLAAIRLVGLDLDFMKTIKDTLKLQVSKYRVPEEVVEKIKAIEDQFTNTDMVARTHFYKHEEVG